MHGPRASGPTPVDPAGARPGWRASRLWLGVAVLALAGGVALLWPSPAPVAIDDAGPANAPVAMTAVEPAPTVLEAVPPGVPAPAPETVSVPARPIAPVVTLRIVRTRDPNGDLTPDLTDYVNEGERPSMAEVIERLHLAGVHEGLGAFAPPGTRPPLIGLAVPEEFVLPPGYVRHYQATDDGQRIEPILMFSPDHPPVDAAGTAIAIPRDRVVPPELAPPGLPIRRIVVPAPAQAGK